MPIRYGALSGVGSGHVFHKSDDLLKSKHWILNSLRSKFSNEIIKNKSEVKFMDANVEERKNSGNRWVMLHIDKLQSDNQADKIEKSEFW
jgi:hypothetical protein